MSEHDEDHSGDPKAKMRKLEAVKSVMEKNDKPLPEESQPEEDDDLTRELLDLYQIPFRRRKPEAL